MISPNNAVAPPIGTISSPDSLEAPLDEQILNENSPIVSFDARLGKKYEFVDFDYGQYGRVADFVGLSPNDSKDLEVKINYPHRILGLANGYYIQHGNTRRVGANLDKHVNKHLAHELKHAADIANGEPSHEVRYLIGLAAIVGSRLYIPGHFLYTTAEILSDQQDTVLTLHVLPYLGLVALKTWGYTYHPSEKMARQAEKENAYKAITYKRLKWPTVIQRSLQRALHSKKAQSTPSGPRS